LHNQKEQYNASKYPGKEVVTDSGKEVVIEYPSHVFLIPPSITILPDYLKVQRIHWFTT
jgi:hypothetical protein